MNDFLKENVDKFELIEECNYLLEKEHLLRGEIIIELLSEVISKNSKHTPRLLSLACSIGVIEEKIKNRLGIIVYGVDAAKKSLETASKRGIITKYVDISKTLPFKDGYFDFVLAGEIIEHLLDTKSFLTEVYRVLKQNGYLLLTTPNLARVDDRLKFLFGKAPRQTSPLHPYLYLHIRPFTFDSLKKALQECGFVEIVLRSNVFRIGFRGKEIKLYSKFFTRFLPTLCSTMIVRTKRPVSKS